ncbi:hypothetical protein ACIGXM_25210 [Kitasatospora sp. NPDC052896]|uniref:hypothetical protein n=1 Tax=Kitasatospora sp. NPDC052896 TaxID=3364061 RepID=UPI0037CC3C71
MSRSIESALADDLPKGESPIAGRLLYQTLQARGLPFEPIHTGGGYFALWLELPDGEILITDDDAQIARPAEFHSTWVACFYRSVEDDIDDEPLEVYIGDGTLSHPEDTAACVSAVSAWLKARQPPHEQHGSRNSLLATPTYQLSA